MICSAGTHGRSAPLPTPSSRRWRQQAPNPRTSKATSGPNGCFSTTSTSSSTSSRRTRVSFTASNDCGETQRRIEDPDRAVARWPITDWPKLRIDRSQFDDSPGCGARCRLRPLLRSLRGAARTPDRRTGLSELLGCDSSPDTAAVRSLRRSAGDVACDRHSAEKCPRCRRRRSAIEQARAIGAYDGALRAIVHALKYEGRRSLAPRLAALMRARCSEVLAGSFCVVPVPLHSSRRRERGFNQAVDLARCLDRPVLKRCVEFAPRHRKRRYQPPGGIKTFGTRLPQRVRRGSSRERSWCLSTTSARRARRWRRVREC